MTLQTIPSFETATGNIDYPFTNDYMFRAILQKDKQVLTALTGHLYSSKFAIHVLDLTQIELATEEDRYYEIDRWARLFKATTWEELRMTARNNPDLLKASNDLYTVNADELIRQQARARADAELLQLKEELAKLKHI